MQEDDDDLRQEHQEDISGYTDYIDYNQMDLLETFLSTKNKCIELIGLVIYEDFTKDDIINYYYDEFEEYCKDSFQAAKDCEQTKSEIIRSMM